MIDKTTTDKIRSSAFYLISCISVVVVVVVVNVASVFFVLFWFLINELYEKLHVCLFPLSVVFLCFFLVLGGGSIAVVL